MRSFPAFLLLLITLHLSAQSPLYLPSNIKKAYTNGSRSADGSPGKNYWQNTADYDLQIKFDPHSMLLEGSATVIYYNNSPDTLHELVLRLYPNYYKKGELRDQVVAYQDENDGVSMDQLSINGENIDTSAKARKIILDNTNMTVLCKSILPHQMARLEMKWHYTLNKGSHSRTGQVEDGAYFIAYCFPRIAVYDDTEGWDKSVFMGNNEPYFDFGNFKAAITVPDQYVVWSTGELKNAAEVFSPEVLEKYKSSFTRERPFFVIDSLDLSKKNVTVHHPWNTFRYEANNVPDLSFALSDHYLWQSSSMEVDPSTKRRAVVNTVFNAKHKDFYEVHSFSRKTVEEMSFDFPGVPYPYPHITVFDGLDQMEYPMMVNDNPLDDREQSIELTDHEIFHTFFPFYMGINQTKYAWMDEGWATVGEWYISAKIDTTLKDGYGMDRVKKYTGRDMDLPLIIPSTETKLSYFINAYPKPGLVYLYLMDMLGDEVFRKSIQYYMKTWNGKHPIPWDFFNCINKASGQNLDWFWKNWFYDWAAIDLGIKNVSKGQVTIENKGGRPVPVYLQVTFADGTKQRYHQSAMVWKDGKKETVIVIKEKKEITSISLENLYVPDGNDADNHYKK